LNSNGYLSLFFCSTLSEFENFLLCERMSPMSQLVKTKRQANFKGFRRFGAFKGLVEQKKTLYLTRSCVNWVFFGTRGPLKSSFHSRFKLAHSCQKKLNLHTNSLNKLLLWKCFYFEKQLFKKIGLRIITINTLATVLHLKALSSLIDQRN
jgi:hypothetical protein